MLMIMIFGRSVWLMEYDQSEDYSKAVCRIGDIEDYQSMRKQTKLYSLTSKFYGVMRIRDLPEDKRKDLKGLKVRTFKGVIGFIAQNGHCVVFLSGHPNLEMAVIEAKKDENRLYPQVVEKDEDVLDWEIVESDDVRCNCMELTSHRYIINFETQLEL